MGHPEQTSRHWGISGLQGTGGAAGNRVGLNTIQPRQSCLHGRAGTPLAVPELRDGLQDPPSLCSSSMLRDNLLKDETGAVTERSAAESGTHSSMVGGRTHM